jgi:hypothetical protein
VVVACGHDRGCPKQGLMSRPGDALMCRGHPDFFWLVLSNRTNSANDRFCLLLDHTSVFQENSLVIRTIYRFTRFGNDS